MASSRKKRGDGAPRDEPSSYPELKEDGASGAPAPRVAKQTLEGERDEDRTPLDASPDAHIASPLVRLFAPGSREGADRLQREAEIAKTHPRAFPTRPIPLDASERTTATAPAHDEAHEPRSKAGDVAGSARATLEFVLRDVLAFLDKMRVDCLCLRGYASFPALPSDAHVHLLVRPIDRDRVVELLEQACKRSGAWVVDRSRADAVDGFTVYANGLPGEHAFLELDVHVHVACGTTPILSADELLPGRYHTKGARIPLAVHEALIQLFDRWLGKGRAEDDIEPECTEATEREAERNRVHFETVARDLLGRRLARELSDHARCGSLRELAPRREQYRRAVLARARMKRPVAWMRAWISRAARALEPLVRPRGRLVAVLGRDEKSRRALSEWITHELRFVVRGRASIVEFRCAPSGDASGTAAQRGIASAWLACLRLHLRRVRHHGRELAVVVCDHYPYDDFLDPMRAGVRLGSPLARWMAKLAPQPDLVMLASDEHRHESDRSSLPRYATFVRGPDGFELVEREVARRSHGEDGAQDEPSRTHAESGPREDARRGDAIVRAVLCGDVRP